MPALSSKNIRVALAAIIIAALAFGAAWALRAQGSATGDSAGALRAAGIDTKEKAAIEALVRDYILEHPEILPQAMERLRAREAQAQLGEVREEVTNPFPGAVLGNPVGERVLVEFSDYACGFCRRAVDDVKALIASDPQLKVVIRELPILSQGSVDAALMALAAARQGKYAAFHEAMFEAGKPGEAAITAAAKSAGLDLARARKDVGDPALMAELRRNSELAATLQFDGTPSWVAGERLFSGAIGAEALREALSAPAQ